MEKRLGIAQLCLLLAVLVFLSVTRGSPGEFHIPRSNSSGSAVDSSRIWGRPNLRRLSGDWTSLSRLRSASSGPPRSASQDSQSHMSTPMASTPFSRASRWPAPSSAFLSPPPSSSTTNTTGPGGHFTKKKAMAMMTKSLSTTPTPTPTFRQKRPPPLYLTPSQHHNHQPHRVPLSRSTHAQVRTRPNTVGGGNASPSPMWPLPKPVPVQRSSSYGGSFVGGGTAAVPRSARRWARSAHLHEVRRARHHHHHHHHNHNHHGVNVSTAADLTGSGENESADDVFAAAPSRRSHIQSTAPVAGYFGTDDALVRMWMRARTQLDERGDGDGDEGGAGTDTWVDTDTDADVDASTGTGTDADADDDSAYGVWPGPGEVD
jgi:hypothetical protein